MMSLWQRMAVWLSTADSAGRPTAARFGGGFEALGERVMPATYVVSLPAGYVATGVAGEAAAVYSGNGYTLAGNGRVTTDSEASAIRQALTGSIMVTLKNAAGNDVSDSYSLGTTGTATVGTAAASHQNFVATAAPIQGDPNRWQLALDDLSSAKFQQAFGAPDYDYNDHFWYVDVTQDKTATRDATLDFTGVTTTQAYTLNITLYAGTASTTTFVKFTPPGTGGTFTSQLADAIPGSADFTATASYIDGKYKLTVSGKGTINLTKVVVQDTQNGVDVNTLTGPVLSAPSQGVTVIVNGNQL